MLVINGDEGCREKDEAKKQNETESVVEVERGRTERCIHFEGERTSLLKLEGDTFVILIIQQAKE